MRVHVPHDVAQVSLRTVPVQIANTSEDEIELASGKNLAKFSVLSESPVCNNSSDTQNYPEFPSCSGVDASKLPDEIEATIDQSLSTEDKAK